MTQLDSILGNRQRRRRRKTFRLVRSLLLTGLPICFGGSALGAENAEWTLLLEPMYMDAFGHDRQVLTVREITGTTDLQTPVALDTEAGFTNRFRLEYRRANWEEWSVGADVIFFGVSQGRPSRTAAADGPAGPVNRVVFDVADRSFASAGVGETLYFSVLEDTDLEVWTTDFFGIRALAESPERRLRLLLGLRNADFDNDYHGIAGVAGSEGALIDAGSNYDRMIGPLIGLAGELQVGRNTLTGYLGYSVVFGSADLGRSIQDFTGPAEAPTFVAGESFERTAVDVSIPMTELRMMWLHPLGRRLAVGVTANASIWSDVPVPPDIEPTAGGGNESTIVFFGIGAAIRLSF